MCQWSGHVDSTGVPEINMRTTGVRTGACERQGRGSKSKKTDEGQENSQGGKRWVV